MKFRPLQDRVLVKRSASEEKSRGGIIIPDNAKEKPVFGTVVDAGPDVNGRVKAGDVIAFGKYAGSEIKIDGEEHVVLLEEDVLGVVE